MLGSFAEEVKRSGRGPGCSFLSGVLTPGHDDLASSNGFDDIELREHANSGINLWGVSRDHSCHGGGGQIDSFPIEVLENRALAGVPSDLDPQHKARETHGRR